MRHIWKIFALVGFLALMASPSHFPWRQPSRLTSNPDEVLPEKAAFYTFYTTTISIPTYPYASHLTTAYAPVYNMSYTKLNWDSYSNSHPAPAPRDYELLVLENDYLRVTLLPELGGRIYQMVFKSTGHNELYQNPVIKPTHWGPPEQGWWLAAGGIEWCLPVDEHGYEWGTSWSYGAVTTTTGITVTLRDTATTDRIRATIAVHLPSDRAYLAITPRLENPTTHAIAYKYWTNAMLAPGESNSVSENLRLIFTPQEVSVHSTGDDRLPGHDTKPTAPDYRISWPVYDGIDFSRLGNWHQWLGFFEYPQAAGSFAGAYDTDADEGLARVFPPDVAQGSKGFGFGWAAPIDTSNWTDDGSTYFELHGGVAPTFWDQATLPAGKSLKWTEVWYPVEGIGLLSSATAQAALGMREKDGYFHIGVHSTTSRPADTGALYVWDHERCHSLAQWHLPDIGPGTAFTASVATAGHSLSNTTFAYLEDDGDVLVSLNRHDCPPPVSQFEPLSHWVETTAFTVTWGRHSLWEGLATYDVQVRDGYEGPWTDWLTHTPALSGTFTGTHGHTYFFRARVRDVYGHLTPYGPDSEEWGQTFTTVLTEPAPVLVTSRKFAAPRLFRANQTIAHTLLISNTGSLTATVTLTDTPPPGLTVLTETLAATPGLTLNYPSHTIQWAGVVTPDDEIRLSYALSPTATTPLGTRLTNTVKISGSLLGPFTRRETIIRAYLTWLPVIVRNWEF